MRKILSKASLGGVVCLALIAFGSPVSFADEADSLTTLMAAPAVDAGILERANGREGNSLNIAELDAVHGFNEANAAQSGAAYIAKGALSDFNGSAAVVVNSGHNALIQVSNQVIFNLY